MYAMVATQPDLAYSIGIVSWYMSNPGRKHWEAIKHILRYLRGTKDAWLTFESNNSTEVEGYTDSNYVGNTDNQKSTSGYVFTYGGGAISWRSKLQECTVLSTIEVGYITKSNTAKEAVWLHRLSIDFLAKRWLDHPALTIHCDSQSAIHFIRNPVYHAKTKHI